jgi:uncharacterized protein (TIGR02996 family)
MSEYAAFLRAIRAAPDDDLPRLAFADWLDERDQPARAEFVRLQVELDPIRDRLENPRVVELRRREAELLAEHRGEWLGGATDTPSGSPALVPVFRRGFLERACLSLDTFLTRGEALFAEHPTLREVAVFDVAGRVEKLAGHRALANVETLEIAEPVFREYGGWFEPLLAALRNADVSRLRVPGVWNSSLAGLVRLISQKPPAATPHRLELVYHRDLPNAVRPEQVAQIRGVNATVLRPFAGPFPIAGGNPEDVVGFVSIRKPVLKRQLLAGHSAGQPALVGVKFTTGEHEFLDYALVHVVTFDPDGRRTGEASHVVSAFAEHAFDGCDRDLSYYVVAKLRDELAFVPGVIRVRPFESAEGLTVSRWPSRLWQYLDVEASGPPEDVSYSEWRNRGGEVWRWLHDGKFVVRWDDKTFVFGDAGEPVA